MKPSIERKKKRISFVIIYAVFMGEWGALVKIPEWNGFPPTLGYDFWTLAMISAAFVALINIKWKLNMEMRSVFFGSLAGLLGAAGHLVLFFYLNKCTRISCVSFTFRFGKAIIIAHMTTSDGMGKTNYPKIKL